MYIVIRAQHYTTFPFPDSEEPEQETKTSRDNQLEFIHHPSENVVERYELTAPDQSYSILERNHPLSTKSLQKKDTSQPNKLTRVHRQRTMVHTKVEADQAQTASYLPGRTRWLASSGTRSGVCMRV